MPESRDYRDACDVAYELGENLMLNDPTDNDVIDEVCSALIIDRSSLTTNEWADVVDDYDMGVEDAFA